jgi:sugar lactone lactonase YvrE
MAGSNMSLSHLPNGRLVLRRPSITGESPVWCERTNRLYWVDVQQPALHRLDPETGLDESWTMPAWIGCLALGEGAERGNVLVGLRTGAYRFALEDGALSLVAPAPYDPRRFFLNDGKCDRAGRFWVGPMRHAVLPLVGEKGPDKGPLWRLQGDRLVPVGKAAALSNGLAWSPDGRTMYHSHTETGEINAWDFDPASGEMERGRLFARVDGPPGPDGAEVDRDGFYWSAINGQGKILRFDPDGKVERELVVPFKYPTMVTFGGPDLQTVFVTSGRWAIPDKDAAEYPLDGGVLAFDAPVPGLPCSRWSG